MQECGAWTSTSPGQIFLPTFKATKHCDPHLFEKRDFGSFMLIFGVNIHFT